MIFSRLGYSSYLHIAHEKRWFELTGKNIMQSTWDANYSDFVGCISRHFGMS